MSTIYLVSKGDYSEYHVLAVFDDKAKAERYAELERGYVEEYQLNPEFREPPNGWFAWSVQMDRDGNGVYGVTRVYQMSASSSIDDVNFEYGWQPTRGVRPAVSFYVWGKDEEHAIKVANEKRVALVATGLWTTDWEEYKKLRGWK